MASVGDTVTNGIQDISALLPLLGTEQCEKHVSCALDKGFLYAAATPLSIFGSLGVVKAGFKVLLASINISRFHFVGAKWLNNAGFAPDGNAAANNNVVSLLALDGSHFVAEARLDEMLQKAHIDDIQKVDLEWDCSLWNVLLSLSTFVGALFALAPYLPLILIHDFHTSPLLWAGWLFPVMRVVGTSLTAVMIQGILQFRVLEITRKRLLVKQAERDDQIMKVLFNDVKLQSLSTDEYIWKIRRELDMLDYDTPAGISKRGTFSRFLPHFHRVPTVDPEAAAASATRPLNPVSTSPEATQCASSHRNSSSSSSHRKPEPASTTTAPVELLTSPQLLSEEAARKCLAELIDKRLGPGDSISRAWLLPMLQGLVSLGMAMSIVGYIGCFSVVQSSASAGPIVWVTVEVALSILRIVIWASNPTWDDRTKLEFTLRLVDDPPEITCSTITEDLFQVNQIFSVLRAEDFLKNIAIYTGPIDPFIHEKITLYYTLAGSRTGDMTLYVTIFDYTERATWTLLVNSWDIIQDPDHSLCSLYGATLDVDPIRNIITVKLNNQVDAQNNPITQDQGFIDKLKLHCFLIMSGIAKADAARADAAKTGAAPYRCYCIPSLWSLKVDLNAESSTVQPGKWPEIGDGDKLYQEIGSSLGLLRKYAERRGESISQGVKMLRANSIAAVTDHQQRSSNLAVSGVLEDAMTKALVLIDLEAHERMEIIWVFEAVALMVISRSYLRLIAGAGGARGSQRRKEWFQFLQGFLETEKEASMKRMQRDYEGDSGISRQLLEPALGRSCDAVQSLWKSQSSRALSDEEDILLPYIFGPDGSSFTSRWSQLVAEELFESQWRHTRLADLSYFDLSTTIVRKLLERSMTARSRVYKQQRAERFVIKDRLSGLLNFTEPATRRIMRDLRRGTTLDAAKLRQLGRNSGFLMARSLEAFIQYDISRLAGVIFNNCKHSHLDIMRSLSIDEYCEMLVQNQSAAVISLGDPYYPQTTSATIQKCAGALKLRETLVTVVLKHVQLDSGAYSALLDAVQSNPRIVSMQFRQALPDTDLESLEGIVRAVEKNYDKMKTRRTTDIVYHHDPDGFRIRGYTRRWYEGDNKCSIYFTLPKDPETTLHVRIIIEEREYARIMDGTQEPFVIQLNNKPLSVDALHTVEDKRHYRVTLEQNYLIERNCLDFAANHKYGRDAFYLLDLMIHDELGFEWNNSALDDDSSDDDLDSSESGASAHDRNESAETVSEKETEFGMAERYETQSNAGDDDSIVSGPASVSIAAGLESSVVTSSPPPMNIVAEETPSPQTIQPRIIEVDDEPSTDDALGVETNHPGTRSGVDTSTGTSI